MNERWLIPLITVYVFFLISWSWNSGWVYCRISVTTSAFGPLGSEKSRTYVCNAAWTPHLHHISHSLHLEKEPFSILDPQLSRFTCSSSGSSDFLTLSDSRGSNVPHSLQSLQDLSGLKRSALKREVACSSETSVPTYKTTRCQNPEVFHLTFF